MDNLTILVLLTIVFALAAIFVFVVYKRRGRVSIKGPLGTELSAEAENEPCAPGPGIKIEDARSRSGSVKVQDRTGRAFPAYVASAVPVASTLHQLPSPPGDFTGRETEIREILSKVEKGIVISSLQGMGGVGKTALACVLSNRLSGQYRDAQFYLDLKGTRTKPLTPAEAMAHVVRAYNPEAKLPEDEAQLSALYHSVLHEKRAILLMDNARDAAQVMPLLPPAGCVLLVTSRWHFTLPGLEARSLDTLLPAEARDLLLAIACRSAAVVGEPSGLPPERGALPTTDARTRAIIAHADEIAKLCGYLPLALRAAGGALAETIDLAPADYAKRLGDARKRLEPIEASLDLSYELLPQKLRARFAALAVFPETFDRAAAAAVWAIEPDAVQDALSSLLKYRLLEYDAAKARYRLHDLVRDFASVRLASAEREEASRRHVAHYAGVARGADWLYLNGGKGITLGLALFDTEWANIQAGQEWAASRAQEDDDAARLCSDYPDAVAYCLSLRQHPRDRVKWLDAALAAARRLKKRVAEGVHLGNLGVAYGQLGETRRAIECYEQQLVITREIGDRGGEGNALGKLGNAYLALGEPRRAIEFYEKALVIDRQTGDRPGEGTDLWNSSLVLDKLGERAQAIAYGKAALKIFEQIEDPNADKVRRKLAEWGAS